LSGQIFQRSVFVSVDAIFGAIVTSHTHRNVMGHPNYGKIIVAQQHWLSLFSLCCLWFTTQLRSGTVNKMAGIFTKRIWQPYLRSICLLALDFAADSSRGSW